jgi:hypothetical protein
MGKLNDVKNKIKTQIEVIKRINDNPIKPINSFDNYLKDLPSNEMLHGKKLSQYSTIKKNRENKKDIFSDLLDTFDGFIGANNILESANTISNKQKLKQIAIDSVSYTLKSTKVVIQDNVNKTFFTGQGICGTNKILNVDSITLKPNEFDFMNVLTIDPISNTGKIVYETDTDIGFIKMNKLLYSGFTEEQSFITKESSTPLFDFSWNENDQEFTFSNLTKSTANIENFILSYYSNIEFPDISGVTKNAMLMTLQGDGSESLLFDKSINNLNRLLNKLFAVCGNPDTGLNQNPTNQFNDNDEDTESYFDFEDTYGVDFNEEQNRYKKVLKFTDCENYEVKLNPQHYEDFVYLSNKNNIFDTINDTLLHTAGETFEKSGQSQSLENFHISLINSFIGNLPKSLISIILSPKYILPIALIYKSVNITTINVKIIMKNLSKMFTKIINDLYWIFLKEFWRLAKVELISLLRNTAKIIVKNKIKKYYTLIKSLLPFLKQLQQTNLNNCDTLYGAISNAIDATLSSTNNNLKIPNILLSLADKKAGYSTDRAFMNILQKLEKRGINTGPIYGEPNKILDLIKSIVEGEDDERNNNGYTKSSNKFFTVNTAAGDAVIFPPGSIPISGINL